jgi:hypothetical protein
MTPQKQIPPGSVRSRIGMTISELLGYFAARFADGPFNESSFNDRPMEVPL